MQKREQRLNEQEEKEKNRKRREKETLQKSRTSKREKKSRIEDVVVLCGMCLEEWREETEEEEIWIGCEGYKDWFHAACIDIDPNNENDYICESSLTPNKQHIAVLTFTMMY